MARALEAVVAAVELGLGGLRVRPPTLQAPRRRPLPQATAAPQPCSRIGQAPGPRTSKKTSSERDAAQQARDAAERDTAAAACEKELSSRTEVLRWAEEADASVRRRADKGETVNLREYEVLRLSLSQAREVMGGVGDAAAETPPPRLPPAPRRPRQLLS